MGTVAVPPRRTKENHSRQLLLCSPEGWRQGAKPRILDLFSLAFLIMPVMESYD